MCFIFLQFILLSYHLLFHIRLSPPTLDHFTDISKMVQIGSGAERKQQDYELTRYACYLIAQNGDSRKK